VPSFPLLRSKAVCPARCLTYLTTSRQADAAYTVDDLQWFTNKTITNIITLLPLLHYYKIHYYYCCIKLLQNITKNTAQRCRKMLFLFFLFFWNRVCIVLTMRTVPEFRDISQTRNSRTLCKSTYALWICIILCSISPNRVCCQFSSASERSAVWLLKAVDRQITALHIVMPSHLTIVSHVTMQFAGHIKTSWAKNLCSCIVFVYREHDLKITMHAKYLPTTKTSQTKDCYSQINTGNHYMGHTVESNA